MELKTGNVKAEFSDSPRDNGRNAAQYESQNVLVKVIQIGSLHHHHDNGGDEFVEGNFFRSALSSGHYFPPANAGDGGVSQGFQGVGVSGKMMDKPSRKRHGLCCL